MPGLFNSRGWPSQWDFAAAKLSRISTLNNYSRSENARQFRAVSQEIPTRVRGTKALSRCSELAFLFFQLLILAECHDLALRVHRATHATKSIEALGHDGEDENS